ncbi:MAG: TetR-like C-terminal domain-containing protein [Lachnospiraceae bacterium]|nr:TetR-like C-terminal domain-containing protein [Lachnospiraceae bacterium]
MNEPCIQVSNLTKSFSKGAAALTAKSLAEELGTSTQPVFTCFGTMDTAKAEVYVTAERLFNEYLMAGLKEKISFFGFGTQYIRFAREEPELYRLLFLIKSDDLERSAFATMQHMQDLVQPSLTSIYHISPQEADRYFRDLWLVVHSLSTLIVTGDCPYSDREIGQILTGFSISIYKAIKEIPGFATGEFDRDAAFRDLIQKE